MFKILTASVASLALVATPAVANDFGGVYGELTAGYDDVIGGTDTTDVVYGAAAGINVPVGKVILGAELTADNVFEHRDLGASARLGYAIGRVLPYAKIGYANYSDVASRKLDGLRVGGGIEYNVSKRTYIKAEYRYTDLQKDLGKHAVLGGVGIRF